MLFDAREHLRLTSLSVRCAIAGLAFKVRLPRTFIVEKYELPLETRRSEIEGDKLAYILIRFNFPFYTEKLSSVYNIAIVSCPRFDFQGVISWSLKYFSAYIRQRKPSLERKGFLSDFS